MKGGDQDILVFTNTGLGYGILYSHEDEGTLDFSTILEKYIVYNIIVHGGGRRLIFDRKLK